MNIYLAVIFSSLIHLGIGTPPSEFAHVKVLRQDRSIFGNYHAEVKAFDQVHKLQLKAPEASVFSPDFKLTIVETDENGNHVFVDKTPTKIEMTNAEKNVYVDPDALAAIRIHSDGDNEPRISGVIDGMVIHHENGRHFVTRLPELNKRASDYVDLHRNTSVPPPSTKIHEVPSSRFEDAIDLHRNLSLSPSNTNGFIPSPRAVTVAQPELLIVFDYDNYQTFKGNTTAITNYLSLFIHSVNNRYANVGDPQVKFVVSGLTAISSATGQPFVTSSAIPGGDAYDINKMLDSFAGWTFNSSSSLAKHDLAALFTGVHLQSKNSQGVYEDGVAGLAYLRATCWVDTVGKKDLGTSVCADARGFYGGLNTVAHELAHNLGSPHDGEKSSTAAYDTSACAWSEGYIMSYEGYGTKSKFYFSSCSKTQMKNFLDTPAASCAKSLQSSSQWTPNKLNPGDFMNMTTQCQLSLKNPKASVDNTKAPSDLCKNLMCRYPDETNPNSIWSASTSKMPADYSFCGASGSCIDGECVIQPNMTAQCQTALNDPKANYDTTKTASSLCQNLSCRYSNSTTKSLNRPAIDHSPCGTKGRCIDNKCDQPVIVIPANMTVQCQKATGKSSAYVDSTKTPDQLCSNLQCRYPDDKNTGTIYIVTLNRRPDDYSPCGTNGNCDNGKCVTLA